MADLATGKEILEQFLRRAGEILPRTTETSGSARVLDAKIYVNDAHWWICAARPYRWARRSPPLQFVAPAEVLVTATSIAETSVVLAGSIGDDVVGWKFMADADGVPHRIASQQTPVDDEPGPSTLGLVTPYTGRATSGAGRIFQDEISVASDILAWPNIIEVPRGSALELISEAEMRERFPSNTFGVSTTKRYGAFITDSILRIAPWTTEARLFECAYNRRAPALTFDGSAADIPLVPQNQRGVIVARALVKLIADKRPEDERGRKAETEVQEYLAALQGTEIGFAKARSWVPRGHRISG